MNNENVMIITSNDKSLNILFKIDKNNKSFWEY